MQYLKKHTFGLVWYFLCDKQLFTNPSDLNHGMIFSIFYTAIIIEEDIYLLCQSISCAIYINYQISLVAQTWQKVRLLLQKCELHIHTIIWLKGKLLQNHKCLPKSTIYLKLKKGVILWREKKLKLKDKKNIFSTKMEQSNFLRLATRL